MNSRKVEIELHDGSSFIGHILRENDDLVVYSEGNGEFYSTKEVEKIFANGKVYTLEEYLKLCDHFNELVTPEPDILEIEFKDGTSCHGDIMDVFEFSTDDKDCGEPETLVIYKKDGEDVARPVSDIAKIYTGGKIYTYEEYERMVDNM